MEKCCPIDIDKIKTIEDLKYLLFATWGIENETQSIGISENYVYFDKIKHLIREEE